MPSKWFPWDFWSNFQADCSEELEGLIHINVFNPYMERLLLKRVESSLGERSVRKVLGAELSVDFWEKHFLNLDLFEQQTDFWVIQAEKMPTAALDWLKMGLLNPAGKRIYCLHCGDFSVQKQMLKAQIGVHYEVSEPPFWEVTKTLDFIAREHHLNLSRRAIDFILEAVPNDFSQFWEVVSRLVPWQQANQSMDVDTVQSLIESQYVDKFVLADFLGQKRWNEFLEQLLRLETDYDYLLESCVFLQSHLMKLADPSYTNKKKRLSKYDRKVIEQSKLWKTSELLEVTHFLTELEIRSKTKDPYLFHELKSVSLNQWREKNQLPTLNWTRVYQPELTI